VAVAKALLDMPALVPCACRALVAARVSGPAYDVLVPPLRLYLIAAPAVAVDRLTVTAPI
jgi:hypothetical protein